MKIHYTFKSGLAVVYPNVADVERFCSLHPYINRVEKVDEGYHVFETVPMFGSNIDENYTIQVKELIPNKHVIYRSQVKKSLTLEIDFVFTETATGTNLTETITIKANPIVKWILGRTMKTAHQKLFGKLV